VQQLLLLHPFKDLCPGLPG